MNLEDELNFDTNKALIVFLVCQQALIVKSGNFKGFGGQTFSVD